MSDEESFDASNEDDATDDKDDEDGAEADIEEETVENGAEDAGDSEKENECDIDSQESEKCEASKESADSEDNANDDEEDDSIEKSEEAEESEDEDSDDEDDDEKEECDEDENEISEAENKEEEVKEEEAKEEEVTEEEKVEENDESKREKRGIAWCDTDYLPETSVRQPTYDWGTYRYNSNPPMGPRMQLFCKTNWMLAIYSQNDVRGSVDDFDGHTFFELSSTPTPGDVRIRCLENDLYLGMKKSGRLYGEPNPMKDNTVFIESLHGSYNNYLSRKWAHLGYYVGLRKSGIVKKGTKTEFGQNAIQFLPRRKYFE